MQADLNLHLSCRFPFADSELVMADERVYWASKLHVAEELAEVALFLAGVAVSEAAVERTFSQQKFIATGLRNALNDAVEQSALFVKFNFLHFGLQNQRRQRLSTGTTTLRCQKWIARMRQSKLKASALTARATFPRSVLRRRTHSRLLIEIEL